MKNRSGYSIIFFSFVCRVTLTVNAVTSTTDKAANDYAFSYGVSDSNTGDHKTHWEKRENGVVSGAYSLLDPDGSTRLVQYKADNTGFHPVVQKLNQPVQSISSLTYPSTTSIPYYRRPSISRSDALYNYNRPSYQSNGYYNGGHYYPETASYRPPVSSVGSDYTSGYLNGYDGYDRSYTGSRLGPYNFERTRQRSQGVPLLHSTYHGYDNLYH